MGDGRSTPFADVEPRFCRGSDYRPLVATGANRKLNFTVGRYRASWLT